MLIHRVLNTEDAKDTEAAKDRKGLAGMRPNEVSYKVIGAAMKVHSALGAGLLESAYDKCLCLEFRRIGLHFQHQVRLPVRNGIHRIINGPESDS